MGEDRIITGISIKPNTNTTIIVTIAINKKDKTIF